MSDDTHAMEFTGERFTPECVREIWYEHFHRYAFAQSFARGKRVLDAACGEGYGSDLLAADAKSVLGVDISDAAIAHARSRYVDRTNLRFEQGDCTALTLPDASFDLVVSFETLEHVVAQEKLLDGFARVLAPDGVFIVSSPDKRTYSDVNGFRNEFHARELYRDELLTLLDARFPHVYLFGQKLLFQSAIWPLDEKSAPAQAQTAVQYGKSVQSGLAYDPLYFVAICARQPLTDLPGIALFGDREESVYAHYNHEVRKNMAAGARIAQLESEVAALKSVQDIPVVESNAKHNRLSWWQRWLSR
jgi:SAM-dependent methyltransferase